MADEIELVRPVPHIRIRENHGIVIARGQQPAIRQGARQMRVEGAEVGPVHVLPQVIEQVGAKADIGRREGQRVNALTNPKPVLIAPARRVDRSKLGIGRITSEVVQRGRSQTQIGRGKGQCVVIATAQTELIHDEWPHMRGNGRPDGVQMRQPTHRIVPDRVEHRRRRSLAQQVLVGIDQALKVVPDEDPVRHFPDRWRQRRPDRPEPHVGFVGVNRQLEGDACQEGGKRRATFFHEQERPDRTGSRAPAQRPTRSRFRQWSLNHSLVLTPPHPTDYRVLAPCKTASALRPSPKGACTAHAMHPHCSVQGYSKRPIDIAVDFRSQL